MAAHSAGGGVVAAPGGGPHVWSTPSALDVAWCGPATVGKGEPGLQVRRIAALPPRRLARPHLGAGAVLVAPGGTFERWRLHVGDCLEVRGE